MNQGDCKIIKEPMNASGMIKLGEVKFGAREKNILSTHIRKNAHYWKTSLPGK